MEIEDCCYRRILSVVVTTDPKVAFESADVVVILGGFPRAPGMERKDLISMNAKGMKVQAEALNQYANRNVKVLIIANPCNTNCLVMRKIATNIPPENFSCLTRLDQERLCSSKESGIRIPRRLTFEDIRHVIIWGNHSNTQVPDITNIEVNVEHTDEKGTVTSRWTRIDQVLDNEWLTNELIPKVQTRGAEVMKAQGMV